MFAVVWSANTRWRNKETVEVKRKKRLQALYSDLSGSAQCSVFHREPPDGQAAGTNWLDSNMSAEILLNTEHLWSILNIMQTGM